ncbi:hypothetical protein DPMN_106347 [Dreissena polymorpha]|uniref:WWE domain-containing protein n=2 Tax=Dreissena polymorpha TaxID=45954 RepID=A0A9D4K4U1_DREPO|nr:hypothetical protein DPMN_106347 [Dreissena polymorpha]
MKGEPFKELIKFVDAFIDEVDKANWNHGLEERLAVIMCGSPTTVLHPFTTQYDDIRGILDQCRPEGKTPLLTALTLALCYVDGKSEAILVGENTLIAPRVIVLSDFNPTSDKEPFDNEDEEAGKANKKIQKHLIQLAKIYCQQMLSLYCVPVGQNKNKKFARELAEHSFGGELISAEDFQRAGNHIRYHVIAARACDDVEAAMARNEDIDAEEIVKEVMSEAKCDGKDKDAIVKVIAKLQSGRKPGAASDEEEPEKDSRTNESTNFKKNKVHVVANVADSGFPGRDQMPFGGGATEPTPGATSGQRNADKMPWWKWQDSQQFWRPFSEEAVKQIEEAKNTKKEFAQVQYKGKNFMVLFNENKCEFEGKRFDVARELVNDDDKMSMIEMDKYMSAI